MSISWTPTQAQLDQLSKLKEKGAISPETSVGAKAFGHRHCVGLNAAMLSAALVPKGLAVSVKRPPYCGEPAMTLYWITVDGLTLLAKAGRA